MEELTGATKPFILANLMNEMLHIDNILLAL